MYFWKCWRDNRMRFIFFVTFTPAVGVLQAVIAWLPSSHDGSSAAVTHYWLEGAKLTGFLLLPLALLTMALGTTGVGEEFAQHSTDFLFTRPRSRGSFIWAWWSSGALAILAIVSAYALVTFFTAVYLTKTVYTWKILASALPVLLVCLACYSLGCLTTTLLRSGRRGYGVGVAVIFLYAMLSSVLRIRSHIRLPNVDDLMIPFWHLVEGVHIPWVVFHFPVFSVASWMLFILACPFVAQWYVERSDV